MTIHAPLAGPAALRDEVGCGQRSVGYFEIQLEARFVALFDGRLREGERQQREECG